MHTFVLWYTCWDQRSLSYGPNLGHWAWWQVPLPAKPPCWPVPFYFRLVTGGIVIGFIDLNSISMPGFVSCWGIFSSWSSTTDWVLNEKAAYFQVKLEKISIPTHKLQLRNTRNAKKQGNVRNEKHDKIWNTMQLNTNRPDESRGKNSSNGKQGRGNCIQISLKQKMNKQKKIIFIANFSNYGTWWRDQTQESVS